MMQVRIGKETGMNKLLGKAIGAAALAIAFASPAMADEAAPAGKWQVKVLGTAVLPDGKISAVRKDLIGLPAGAQTVASDNAFTPTLAIEYFALPNVSVETICCFTSHHVSGAGSLAGASLVDHALILPATITAKYHLPLPGGIKPYVGAGGAWFFYIDERPGATAKTLGASRVKLDNDAGVVVQAGVDVPLTKSGLGLTLDAKKYFIDTTAHFYTASGVEALTTRHKISPWVLSAGVAYRF